jgi:serine/threonine protein kinase
MSGGEKLASIWSLYSPVKLLAHGGSSEVWLVHRKDDEQGPALALKMLSMTETHRAEFERERALMGRVQDKHVMKLVASHETPNHLVLITEVRLFSL